MSNDTTGPARRLVERAMTASDALATAINPNIPRLRFMYAPLKPHIQALEDVRAEADALDARYAALEAQLAAADEVMAGQVARARAAYEQRCAELEAQLSAMEWVAKTHGEQSEAKSRRIAALEAQLAEAQAQLDAAIRLGIRQTGEMAALERLRAERWEPVADGKDCTENIHYTVRPDGDHIIVTPTWGGTPHRLYLGKARRLCQRVTGAQPGEGCDE